MRVKLKMRDKGEVSAPRPGSRVVGSLTSVMDTNLFLWLLALWFFLQSCLDEVDELI